MVTITGNSAIGVNYCSPYLKQDSNSCQINPVIAGELKKNMDKDKILLSFNDERLKDPYRDLNNNGQFNPNNKDWNLVCSYNGFFAFQYGTGDYLQIYRLTPGYSEIFSKAMEKQQTLRKDSSTGKVTEVKE